MRYILVACLAAGLGGCKTTEDRIAEDDAKCLSYGVPKGSQAYIDCRARLDQQRADVRASERFGNDGGLFGAIRRASE